MDVQSQLLIYGVLPEPKNYGGRTKGVRRLASRPSTPEGVPLRSAIEGARGYTH